MTGTMIAHPSACRPPRARPRRPGARRRRRATRGGRRRPTGRTRSRCWRSRTATREPDLVPVRHGRMIVSPFTFYRGAAKIMAADLAGTPTAGLTVQLCGDAHLSNFGGFASPERRLLFDLNDFDETLPGPFEYDVKRMAASFTIAARNNGLTTAEGKSATAASVRAYREAMAQFARMRTMDLWYAHLSEDDLRAAIAKIAPQGLRKKDVKSGQGLESVNGIEGLEHRADPEGRPGGGPARRATGRQDHAQGAHQGQPAGPVQAR